MKLKLLFIGLIITLCFNTNCQDIKNKTQTKPPEKMEIIFEKEILTDIEASLGTMSMAKIGDYLILHDSHVSDRKLVCIEYSTGKEIWKIENGVHRFYVYNDNVIIEFNNYIALHNVKSGKEIWRKESVSISYNYHKSDIVTNNILANHNGEKVVFDLETQTVKLYDKGIIGAYYFQFDEQNVKKSLIGTENYYNCENKLLSIIIVNDDNDERRDYVWSLDEQKREFNLSCFDSERKKINEHFWKMDEGEQLPKNMFDGNPEPDKLSGSMYFIEDKLFLFENYVNYRWSWNRGTNRISCIDWKTGNIKYQKWGQAPGEKEFKTFLFFDNTILYSDNIMHFQDGDGRFSKFDFLKGKVLDSLPQKATLFKNYNKDYLLGFSYERKHIKEKEYTNAVEMKFWNMHTNIFSDTYRFDFKSYYPFEPFVFSDDGLVILYFYLKDKKRSTLKCYRVTEN